MITKIHYCPNCAHVYTDATIQECTTCHTPVTHFELETPGVDLVEQDKAERNYRSGMRSMVRGLWSGVLDLDQAFAVGETTIRFGLTNAWHAGLKSVGDTPAEQSPEQRIELQQMITREISLLFPFLLDIEAGSKANGGKLAPQMKRAEMWAIRARDAENQARTSSLKDPKLKWVIGPTEESCRSCSALNGKIKKASFWRRLDLRPQNPPNPKIICQGFNCLCEFVPTTEPLSRGPLPRTP